MDREKSERSLYWPALLASAFLCFTLFFFGAIDTYLANIENLWFGFGTFWWRLFIVATAAGVICALVLLLLKKLNDNLYRHGLSLLFGVGLAIFVQGYFLSARGIAPGGEGVDWSLRLWPMMLDLAIWIALIVLPLFLCDLSPKYGLMVIGVLSGGLLVVQIFGFLITSMGAPLDKQTTAVYLSKQGLFDMSKKENAIVFVVDSFGQADLGAIEERNPEKLAFLDGFTNYPNSISGSAGAYVNLMTGGRDLETDSLTEFFDTALKTDTIWHALKEKNYSVRLLEKGEWAYQTGQKALFDNLVEVAYIPTSKLSLCKVLLRMMGYRFAPEALRPFLAIDFYEVFETYKALPSGSPSAYTKNDARFYKDLAKARPMRAEYEENAFRLYFLQGVSAPYSLNESAEKVDKTQTDRYQHSLGILVIVDEYLRQLKEWGLYDDSTILLMADHGGENPTDKPIFLMKGAGTRGEMERSFAPVGYADFCAEMVR